VKAASGPEDLLPFVRLALACVQRPYPYHMVHVVRSDDDVRPPRELNPAFCGCFDWHSAVHSHWTLIRALRVCAGAPWGDEVCSVLWHHFDPSNLASEAHYLRERPGFERPYGLAWLLQLCAELREWNNRGGNEWLRRLEPLESIAVARLSEWLPKLSHPIRSGEHSQTAFAMGLALDWSRVAQDSRFERLLVSRSRDFHERDRAAPLHYEPSGHDFLSPSLAEADLMRRVMQRDEFSAWLGAFLPQVPRDGSIGWLMPVRSSDPSDGKLSHLDGLSLSRAWMLEGIAQGLEPGDARRASLVATARMHGDAGVGAIEAQHYAGAHWLGSFAAYFRTGRGRLQEITSRA
jgi:hypothetical protein